MADKEKAFRWLADHLSNVNAVGLSPKRIVNIIQQKHNEYESVKKSTKFSLSQPTFYSNAEFAVQNIKLEKATPEQWLKMIEKNGGLMAGEVEAAMSLHVSI